METGFTIEAIRMANARMREKINADKDYTSHLTTEDISASLSRTAKKFFNHEGNFYHER